MRKIVLVLLAACFALGGCVDSGSATATATTAAPAPTTYAAVEETETEAASTQTKAIVSQESNFLHGILAQSDITPGIYQTISMDYESYFAIKNDSSLWAWGNNCCGQFGIGTETDIDDPPQMEPVFVMENVQAVSTGGSSHGTHTLILKTDGTLWACGSNTANQLGDGISGNGSNIPVYIMDNVVTPVCADGSSFVIKADHSLWVWGDNYFGQLGTGSTEPQSSPIKVMDGVQSVSSDGARTFAIKTDGTLWVWGFNPQHLDNNSTIITVPMKMMDNVTAVFTNRISSCAIKTDGSLWVWGIWNSNTTDTPTYFMDNVAAVTLKLNDDMSALVLKNDGTLWQVFIFEPYICYWNDNNWELWNGTEEQQTQTDKIVAIDGDIIVDSDGTLSTLNVYSGKSFTIMDDVKIP